MNANDAAAKQSGGAPIFDIFFAFAPGTAEMTAGNCDILPVLLLAAAAGMGREFAVWGGNGVWCILWIL